MNDIIRETNVFVHQNDSFYGYYDEYKEQGQKFVLFLKIYLFLLGTMSQPHALF